MRDARALPEQAERLREALARTHEAPLADYRRLDTLLHLTLAELSGSPSLTAQYAAVRASVNDLLDCIPSWSATWSTPSASTPRWSRRCSTGTRTGRGR